MSAQPTGLDVALEILSTRLYSDCSAKRKHEPELLEAGRELLRQVTFARSNQSSDHKLVRIAKACLTDPDAGPIAAALVERLKQAATVYEIYFFDHNDLLRALLEAQPAAVLDALLLGEDRWAGHGLIEHLGDGGNLTDAISCEALIAWCEGDREHRYPLAASIITFACRLEATGSQAWSEQAKALLANAPDPKNVLPVFVNRFRPMSWSGSRAALIEANARLLDSVESLVPSGLMPFVTEVKAQLAQEVAQLRQQEREQDRARDERFE